MRSKRAFLTRRGRSWLRHYKVEVYLLANVTPVRPLSTEGPGRSKRQDENYTLVTRLATYVGDVLQQNAT